MLPTDGKRNSPNFSVNLIRALCDHSLWYSRRQAINPLLPIPTAADQALLWWPSKSPNLMPCDFFLRGYVTDSVFLLPLPQYHRICLSCEDEVLLPSQKLIMTHFSGYGWKWIINLISAMSHLWGERREFLFPSVAFMLQSLPTFKCTTCTKYARELQITLYS